MKIRNQLLRPVGGDFNLLTYKKDEMAAEILFGVNIKIILKLPPLRLFQNKDFTGKHKEAYLGLF